MKRGGMWDKTGEHKSPQQPLRGEIILKKFTREDRADKKSYRKGRPFRGARRGYKGKNKLCGNVSGTSSLSARGRNGGLKKLEKQMKRGDAENN